MVKAKPVASDAASRVPTPTTLVFWLPDAMAIRLSFATCLAATATTVPSSLRGDDATTEMRTLSRKASISI